MSSAKLTVFLSERWRRLLLCGKLSFCSSFKSEMLIVLVLSSVGGAGIGCVGCAGIGCMEMFLVFSPDKILEMSLGPRMSGRLDTVMGSLDPILRAAFKSGRLEVGGAAVLFPARNGVPASELGSRTLVGIGGGGGLWFGM